jgi:16S rRNA (cytidine1402-2'-O)-methyltransferase
LGTLFVVATPIGNLEDITLRAIRVLREANLIAAEDTRTTRVLLRKHGIDTRLVSYNEHNMRRRTPELLAALETADIALVSEAGTPGVSDPGHELIIATIESGFPVVPIPGPSAVVAALVASGLPMREFTFLGFLPRRASERRRALTAAARERRTTVFFESPHRLLQTLEAVRDIFGDRRLAVCRELTKTFEETFRGTAAEALVHFQEPRGELTIVIEGTTDDQPTTSDEEVRRQLENAKASGLSARDAVKTVTQTTGRPHRYVYALWLETVRAPDHQPLTPTPPPTRTAQRPSAP